MFWLAALYHTDYGYINRHCTSVSSANTPAAAETVAVAVVTGLSSLRATDDPNISEVASASTATSLPVARVGFDKVAQMGNNDVMTDGSGIEIELESSFGADMPIFRASVHMSQVHDV